VRCWLSYRRIPIGAVGEYRRAVQCSACPSPRNLKFHGLALALIFGLAAVNFVNPAAAVEWNLRKVFAPTNLPDAIWGHKNNAIKGLLKPVVFRLRAAKRGKITRLELTATQKFNVDAFLLANPDRVIIDLPAVLFQFEASGRNGKRPEAPKPTGLIRTYRFGSLGKDRSRIVVDLAAPARIAKVSTVKIASTVHRMRVDLRESGRASFVTAAAAGRKEALARSRKAVNGIKGFSPVSGGKPVIVIDPGHGGIDSGARGEAIAPEKAIVLAFSKALAKKIAKSGKYKVVLTRQSDVFVPLAERVAIARRAKARLFISIHADSLNQKSVRGATVYTVSDRASDKHAERFAEKENRADEKAGFEQPRVDSELNDILFDLTRRETRAFSHIFAHKLIRRWSKVGKLNKNPHRSGGFHVLKAPDVPSVLLELGYISSAKDAALLDSKEWRVSAASEVSMAIDLFFKARNGVVKADAASPKGGGNGSRLASTEKGKKGGEQ